MTSPVPFAERRIIKKTNRETSTKKLTTEKRKKYQEIDDRKSEKRAFERSPFLYCKDPGTQMIPGLGRDRIIFEKQDLCTIRIRKTG